MASRDWTNLMWAEKTWWERVQTVLCFAAACVFCFGGFFLFVGYVVGPSLDGIARYNTEHRRCLEKATNGLEIEGCR